MARACLLSDEKSFPFGVRNLACQFGGRHEMVPKEELKRRPKWDGIKAQVAVCLRERPTMTWPWIAERLEMGHWRTAVNAVRNKISERKIKT